MKAYKVTVLVIDYDDMGASEIKTTIENGDYYVNPQVMDIQGVEIGEWEDSNPLNNRNTAKAEFNRLFRE
jgi:hypothetical protein